MKVDSNINYFSITEVCQRLGVTRQTILNWEEYAKSHPEVILPNPRRNFDLKNSRYYTEEQIEQLREFQKTIKYGQMAEINRKKWGKRCPKMD